MKKTLFFDIIQHAFYFWKGILMRLSTKHGLAELTRKYRSVLKKCALINAMAATVILAGIHTASAAPDPASDYWRVRETRIYPAAL